MIIHWDKIPSEYNIVVVSQTEFEVPAIAVNEQGFMMLKEDEQYTVEYTDNFREDDCFYEENIVSFHRPKDVGK